MHKVSIIIPIYNVENYLEKCLNSVINQTYNNLEIICVNDLSPDNSQKIIEKYLKKDHRIKSINRGKNGGLSAARISGYEVATGDYIYFLDSDDWIALDFIEKMYCTIIKENLNAVCCTNVKNVYEDNSTSYFLKRADNGFVPYTKACQMAWSWLLKKDFLDKFDMIFPLGLKYEDFYFFHYCIRSLDTVYILNDTTYYHFENKNSIMGSAINRKIDNDNILDNLQLIYEKYKKENKLEKWSIPFFYMPKYMLNIHKNKNEFYLKLRKFLLSIEQDVVANSSLYYKIELDFLADILKHKTYQEYKKLDMSIIQTLRKNIDK